MATQHQLSAPLVITYITTFGFIAAGAVLIVLVAFESAIPALPPLDALYGTLVAIILLLLGTNCLLIALFLHQDERRGYLTTGSGRRPQPTRTRDAAPARGERADPGPTGATPHPAESDDDSHASFKPDTTPNRHSTTDDAELGSPIRPDADTTTASTDGDDDAGDDGTDEDPAHDPHAPFKPDS